MKPLTEKYRPKTLSEVVGQDVAVKVLSSYVKSFHEDSTFRPPNLLFYGPPGTGKTTLARAFARDLFGKEWTKAFLDMNASDERGVETIRKKVKDYVRSMSFITPFKIVFLDEADALTKEAQNILRRVMEDYSGNCIFILSANYPTRIIPPLRSRCQNFPIGYVEEEEILKHLKDISVKEGADLEIGLLRKMAKYSRGSVRDALQILGQVIQGGLTEEDIKSIYDADYTYIAKAYDLIPKGPEKAIRVLLAGIWKGRYTPTDVVRVFFDKLTQEALPEKVKVKALTRWADYDYYIISGGTYNVQIPSMVWYIYALKKKYGNNVGDM